MPSTNQTDLAGREWKTTPEERERERAWLRQWSNPPAFVWCLLDDLETALAKVEALEAEMRDMAGSYLDAHARSTENKYRAEAAEARVTELEGALRGASDDFTILDRAIFTDPQEIERAGPMRSFIEVARRKVEALLPDPAEQPEAGRIAALRPLVNCVAALRPAEPAQARADVLEEAVVPRSGRAVTITKKEADQREARGLHVEWAEGVCLHYFPGEDDR